MCQTNLITNRVILLSRRSFNHRIEAVSPKGYRYSQLQKLNKDLDRLYETIYDDWTTITEDDYKVFGGQLVILIQTIKQLYDTCRKCPKEMGISNETKKLGLNYSALYELNSDIVNFRIKLPKNQKMKTVLKEISKLDRSNVAERV